MALTISGINKNRNFKLLFSTEKAPTSWKWAYSESWLYIICLQCLTYRMSISVISSKRRYLAAFPAASGSQSAIFDLKCKISTFSTSKQELFARTSYSLLTWLWSEFRLEKWLALYPWWLLSTSWTKKVMGSKLWAEVSLFLIYSLPARQFCLFRSKFENFANKGVSGTSLFDQERANKGRIFEFNPFRSSFSVRLLGPRTTNSHYICAASHGASDRWSV